MSTFRNLLTIWPLTSLHNIQGSQLCLAALHASLTLLHVNCENWREMALVAIIAAAWEPTTSHTQTAFAKCLHIYNSAQVYSPWWRWPSWLRGSALCVHYSNLSFTGVYHVIPARASSSAWSLGPLSPTRGPRHPPAPRGLEAEAHWEWGVGKYMLGISLY